MIKKTKGKYVVMSESTDSTDRSFGIYGTMKGAKRRLAQMEFFKHLGKSPKMRKGLHKKSLLK